MECRTWEEQGLLYVSGELETEQRADFERHTHVCPQCREELDAYHLLKQSFLTSEFLAESPSDSTDRKILEHAGHRPIVTSLGLFSTVIKKTTVALFLLLLGFGGTGYVVYVMRSVPDEQPVAGNQSLHAVPGDNEVVVQGEAGTSDSSRADSGAATVDSRPFGERLGNPDRGGVAPGVPVDATR